MDLTVAHEWPEAFAHSGFDSNKESGFTSSDGLSEVDEPIFASSEDGSSSTSSSNSSDEDWDSSDPANIDSESDGNGGNN